MGREQPQMQQFAPLGCVLDSPSPSPSRSLDHRFPSFSPNLLRVPGRVDFLVVVTPHQPLATNHWPPVTSPWWASFGEGAEEPPARG